MSTADELYQRIILDHAKNPRHSALPEPADASADGFNPLCGDRVRVGVRLEGDTVAALGCESKACAICVAAASTMAIAVAGQTVAASRVLAERFAAQLEPAAEPDPDLGDLAAFRGVSRFPTRRRCARLPWDTLDDAINAAQGADHA